MSFKAKIRVLAVCLILEAGVLMHCPMRPEEIEEIMHEMNQPKLAHALPSDDYDGDGPKPAQPPLSKEDRYALGVRHGKPAVLSAAHPASRSGQSADEVAQAAQPGGNGNPLWLLLWPDF